MNLSTQARKTIAVFQAMASCRRKYGPEAIGPFIVSMTQGADDILSVILLAQWGGLHNKRGEVPLDIAPLLETVDDLQNGPTILKSLMSSELYRKHVKRRDDRQMIMIGYSDSNKDGGLASARWALQNAQEVIVKTAHGALTIGAKQIRWIDDDLSPAAKAVQSDPREGRHPIAGP